MIAWFTVILFWAAQVVGETGMYGGKWAAPGYEYYRKLHGITAIAALMSGNDQWMVWWYAASAVYSVPSLISRDTTRVSSNMKIWTLLASTLCVYAYERGEMQADGLLFLVATIISFRAGPKLVDTTYLIRFFCLGGIMLFATGNFALLKQVNVVFFFAKGFVTHWG